MRIIVDGSISLASKLYLLTVFDAENLIKFKHDRFNEIENPFLKRFLISYI